jgi:hypothetical protein
MAQEGFAYERNAYSALKIFKISTGLTAGAAHDVPDLTIQRAGKEAGVELKNSPTAAGSLVMKYHKGKWSYGDYSIDEEKRFIHDLAESKKLLKEMNTSGVAGKAWRAAGAPHLQNEAAGKKITVPATLSREEAYKKDIARFGGANEIYLEIPASAICDYYIAKKCSYINVGTHGFYTLNGKDALGLNKILTKNKQPTIPDFASSASATIRVRCQYKGKGDYQFVTTMQFSGVKSSPYNIAPLKRGSKSEIETKILKNSPLVEAFMR